MINKHVTYYDDGDIHYAPPSWRQTLDGKNSEFSQLDSAAEHDRDALIKEDEIALKHPEKTSVVKLTDDGMIDIFAGDQLGIRLDPNTNSINMFAQNLNLFGTNVQFRTTPYGMSWNGKTISPDLLKEMEDSTKKTRYSEGMLEIMTSLGLPIDKEE